MSESDETQGASPAAVPPAPPVSWPLAPLPPGAIPEAFAKNADPTSPAPSRMMAARAMAPIPPKALVPVIYQLQMDPDPRIAAAARKSFANLDDKLVAPVLQEAPPPVLLEAFCHTLLGRFDLLERVLLNKNTPDGGFEWVAAHAEDARAVTIVVENQERLLRAHNIVRGLKQNPKVLRSDLDKAVDFLVREGVFLDDVSEFEDSFLRLGKAEMLEALKKVKISEEHLTERERKKAQELGVSAEEFILGTEGVLSDDEREALLDVIADEDTEVDTARVPFLKLPVPIQVKLAMSGPHEKAIEALSSSNKMVAGAAIRNPKINENDIVKISRSKTMHEDVIRYICNNGDWTKAYSVKMNLVQNPKTPTTLVMRWLPLLRGTDLKSLSKSKQIPSSVAIQAKRLLAAKNMS